MNKDISRQALNLLHSQPDKPTQREKNTQEQMKRASDINSTQPTIRRDTIGDKTTRNTKKFKPAKKIFTGEEKRYQDLRQMEERQF